MAADPHARGYDDHKQQVQQLTDDRAKFTAQKLSYAFAFTFVRVVGACIACARCACVRACVHCVRVCVRVFRLRFAFVFDVLGSFKVGVVCTYLHNTEYCVFWFVYPMCALV